MPRSPGVLPYSLAVPTAFTEGVKNAKKANQKANGHAAAGGEEIRPLIFVQGHTLHNKPITEREWGVQDWLPIGCVTGNWGDGGTGKTLLSQQLMTSCATGKPWLGLAAMRCRVLGLFCEDPQDEVHRRQDRINQAYGINFDDLEDMAWACAVGDDNALIRFDHDGRAHDTPRLAEFIKEAAAFQARLLVIDTAADTFPDDENKRSAVRSFVSRLNRLAQDQQAAVLLNLHPSRSGMSTTGDMDGGSTAWSNTVRSRWSLERPKPADGDAPDNNDRVLTRRKANYASIGDTLKLTWSGGVLAPAKRPNSFAAMSDAANCEATFLDLLAKADAINMPVSSATTAHNFAPRVFAARPDRQCFNRRDFEAAMQRLMAAGKITLKNYGRKGDERRCLAIPEVAESV